MPRPLLFSLSKTSIWVFAITTLLAGIAELAASGADARVEEAVQVHYFDTGYDGTGTPLLIPSIDPAGITYHAPSGHLFIADSEINEVPEVFGDVGGNIFEVSTAGDSLLAIYDTTPEGNNEPTGIAFNEFDGHFYMSNDDAKKVYRYSFDPGTGFSIDAEVSTSTTAASNDPEGLTVDPATGLIYVVDGVGKLLVVYSFDEIADPPAFVFESVYDLAALNGAADVPTDPEGIAFDSETGHLFISSDPDKAVYEYTTAGIFVSEIGIDALSPATDAPQGLCFGPVSPSGGDLAAQSLYIADGRVDNNEDPNERDGSIYELAIVEQGTTNLPPILDPIGDQAIDEGSLLTFTATATDQDDPPDELTFSLGGLVPSGASIDPVTGVFVWTPTEVQGPEVYVVVVRVTDDGIPSLFDEETIELTVNELNQPPVLDPIGDQNAIGGVELSFTATADDPDLAPGLREGLIAHWPFDIDFTSGTGGYDGVGMNGAMITSTPGEYVLGVGALSLDGINDFVDFGDLSLAGDLTLSAWVHAENIAPISDSDAIVFGDGSNADWIRLESDGVRAKWNNVTVVMTTEPDFGNSSWQHFMLVRSGSQVTLYRNGQIVGSGVHTATFTPEYLGLKTPNTDYYQGFMDDVAVWERALTFEEVVSLYNSGDGWAIGDAEGAPANTLTFSLEGSVPTGANIDPTTGVFSWTPSESQTPGEYTFSVRVTDDGVPSFHDEETLTVFVEDGPPPPPEILPIDDQMVDEETNLSFTVSLVGTSGPDFSESLAAYWPFDSDFGDVVGSHDGTGVGDATILSSGGKLGAGALYLDGAGDYLDIGDLPLTGDLSVSVWLLPEAIQSGTAGGANGIVLGDTGNADWLRLELEAVRAKWNGTTVVGTTEPDFTNGSWQHFVLVRTGTQVTVYRNNVLVATFTHTQPFTPELIGCKTSGGNYYQGTMDDMAIWTRALSTQDVADLYNNGDGLVVLPPPGDSAVFSLEGTVPTGASIDPDSGLFTWTPDETQGPNVYPFTVKATDAEDPGLFDTEDFAVTVDEVNVPPVLDPIGDLQIEEGQTLTFTAVASDPDLPSNMLTFSLGEAQIEGMTIDPMTGLFEWTPSEAQGPATYSVVVRVTDDGVPPLFADEPILVTVMEANSAPVLDPIGDKMVLVETELTFTALASDPDLQPSVEDGLIAYWPFDTDFGSGTGIHDGVPVNGAAISNLAGEFVLGGGALRLDGLDDYLDFGAVPLPIDFSIAAWVYPENVDSLTASDAIVLGDGSNANWLRLEADGIRVKWDNVTTVLTSEPDFVNDMWQHLVVTRSGTTVSVFRNAELVASGSIPSTFTPEYLGLKTPNSNYYRGGMDDVGIWNRVLSADDIAAIYNGGSGIAIGDAPPEPANSLTFSLEGEAPVGAAIDPASGVFSWTPTIDQGPASYVFSVRVTDDGAPPLFAEEEITVDVLLEEPEPICQVDPASLDFGTVQLGDSLAAGFTIRNLGGGTLGGEVGEACDHFRVVENGGPFSLQAGDSLLVTVSFEPLEIGEFSCTIELGDSLCTDVSCIGTGDNTSSVEEVGFDFGLTQNYPNPFSGATRMEFGLATESEVTLIIYDIAGRQVRSLLRGTFPAGNRSVVWDGHDDQGREQSSGIYFARLQAGRNTVLRVLTLLK